MSDHDFPSAARQQPLTPPAPPNYPGQQYSAAPQPYMTPGYPMPAPRPASGLAITSLVCGIAGLVLFWALIPMLASIVAVVTGHMALGQTKRDPSIGGRGMAFAGLILGYVVVGILLFTIATTIISIVLVGAFTLPFVFAG
ncbi:MULTISPECIES: DUF4190 domain-containing protein [unclassified Microbacterium]|uniref:DUF4190 domain-containing protein n=1 Tax=unclassified Microbacterium TaxID=2609290 RepID=UPI00217CE292|nr:MULTISPECIES: DUF4190 domain-containing protein [unclassified Microbacterium]